MAESDLEKYLRQLTTGGRVDTGLITSRPNLRPQPVMPQQAAPAAAPNRFNYNGPTVAPAPQAPPGMFRQMLGTLGSGAGGLMSLGLKSLGPLDYGRRAVLATMSEFDKRGDADYWDFGDSTLGNIAEQALGIGFDIPTKISGYDSLPAIAESIRNMRGIEAQKPKDRESTQDLGWWDKFRDPEFGYGRILYDKSGGGFETALSGSAAGEFAGRTLDKIGGFAGDVVADPTTYLTGGASAIAGKANRFAMASRIAQKAGKIPGVSRQQIDEWVIKMAGEGPRAFTNAERALINEPYLFERGLRLGNPMGGAGTVRIPGTAKIDDFFSALVAKPRQRITSSAAYNSIIESRRAPQGLEDVYKVLRTGKARGGLTPTMAALALNAKDTLGAAKGLYVAQWSNGMQEIFDGLDQDARIALTDAVQSGVADGKAGELTSILQNIRQSLVDEGLDIGDITQIAGVEGFMPFMLTREVLDLSSAEAVDQSLALALRRGFKMDLTKRQGMTMPRGIRPGSKITFKFGDETVEVAFDKATIKEANERLTEAFPNLGITKWFEDDAGILMTRYIDEASTSAGQARMIFELLNGSPDDIVDNLQNVSTEVLDDVATRTKNVQAREYLDQIIAQRNEEAATRGAQIVQDANEMTGVLIEALQENLRNLGRIGGIVAQEINVAKARKVSLTEAKKTITKRFSEERKQLTQVLKDSETAFFTLSEEADRLRFAVASGQDPQGVPWHEVTRRALVENRGDRRAALKKIEFLRDQKQKQIDQIASTFEAMQSVIEELNFAEYMKTQIEEVLDDPKALRQLLEEEDANLFERYVEEHRVLLGSGEPSAAEAADLERARRDLRAKESEFEDWALGVDKDNTPRGVIPVAASQERSSLSSVRNAQFRVDGYREAVRRSWNALDAGTRRAQEKIAADAVRAAHRKLDDLVHLVGASRYEVDPKGKISFIWGADEKEFAYDVAKQIQVDFADWRVSMQEAGERLLAADSAAMAADQRLNLQTDWWGEWSDVLLSARDDVDQATAVYVAAEAFFDAAKAENPRAVLISRFDELFNAGANEVDRVDFSNWFPEGMIQIQRSELSVQQSLEQFGDRLYQQFLKLKDEAIANAPLSKEYRDLLFASAQYKQARRDLRAATDLHRKTKSTHQSLRRQYDSGQLKANYLSAARHAVKRAEKRLGAASTRYDIAADIIYETRVRPIVEGAEAGRLPYEREALERNEFMQDFSVPFVPSAEVSKQIQSGPVRYEFVTDKREVSVLAPLNLTPEERRARELSRMSPEEIAIYGGGDELDERFIDKSAQTVDDLLGDAEDVAGEVVEEAGTSRKFGEFTPEERAANTAKRRAGLQRKTQLLQGLGDGTVTPLQAWRLAVEDDNYKNIRVFDVLANLPGSSNVRAEIVMNEVGITRGRRLRAMKVDNPSLGPEKFHQALQLIGQLKPKARPDQGTIRGMLDVVLAIKEDGLVPVEVVERLTTIASRFNEQDALARGLSLATARDEKVAAHYRRRIDSLRSALEFARERGMKKGGANAEKQVTRIQNDLYQVRSALATLDEDAVSRSHLVSHKMMSHSEAFELEREFRDLIEWSNMYARGVAVGVEEGEKLSARVTGELLYKRRNAAVQRLGQSENPSAFKRGAKQRRMAQSPDDVLVEEAVETLLPQLDALMMVEAQRRQLRRRAKEAESVSKRKIQGLDDFIVDAGLTDLAEPPSLRDDLIAARIRTEDDFVDPEIERLMGNSRSIDYNENGFSITYGEPSDELKERVKQLGQELTTIRRDFAVSLGVLFDIGASAGDDLSMRGKLRQEFSKEARKAFREGGRVGLEKIVRKYLPQVPGSRKGALLRKARDANKNDRILVDNLNRQIASLGIGSGKATQGQLQKDFDKAVNYVKELKSEIRNARKAGRSAVQIELMRKRLVVAEQLADRAEKKLNSFVPSGAGRPTISVDWRDVLDVAPEGYVSPLIADNSNWDEVMHSYAFLRENLEWWKAKYVARRDEYIYGEGATALERNAVDIGLRPTRARRLELDANKLQRELAETDDALVAAERSLTEIPTVREVMRSVRDQRDEVLERAGLLDEISVKLSQQFDDVTEMLAQVDLNEAAEIARAETLIDETAQGVKDLEARLREVNGTKKAGTGIAGAQKKLDRLQADGFSFDNVKDVTAELKGIVDSVDPNDMHGMVAEAMYLKHLDDIAALKVTEMYEIPNLKALRDRAAQEQLHQIFKYKANKGFVEMGEILGKDRMIAVAEPLARAISNIDKSMQTGAFIETIELANRFFKTYATLTPGFHVRNWMGASFMNLSEGVEVKNTREAYGIAAEFRKDANGYISSLRARAANGDEVAVRHLDALEAAFGSGASGRLSFGEIGKSNAQSNLVKNAMNTKTADALLANKAVRLSQSVGTNFVELPARMALALDSFDRGMTKLQAIGRIKRVHFDYSELSKFDKKMKALIPFWTFMSRNLPLQMQQILLKPKMYTAYNSVIRNFKADNQDMLQWQEERNGWVLFNDSGMFGGSQNIAILPDLQHVSMVDDLSKADPRNPLRFLSQMNPMVRVPAEFALDKKFYKNQPFYQDENKAEYALLQSLPPAAQAARLLGPLTGIGPYKDRAPLQSGLNYLGVPLYGTE